MLDLAFAEGPPDASGVPSDPSTLLKPLSLLPGLEQSDAEFRDSWQGHLPFVQWLLRQARPATLVVLGPGGAAFHAALEDMAARDESPARCIVAEAWTEVLRGLPAAAPTDSSPEAWSLARAGAIDLLVLGCVPWGVGAQGAVDVWLSGLSPRGLLLLHPTRQASDGGRGPLWARMHALHPSFEVPHAGGIGLLAVGPEAPEAVRVLCALRDPEAVERVRMRFAALGERRQRENDRREAAQTLAAARRQAAEAERERDQMAARLASVLGSTSWRVTAPLRGMGAALARARAREAARRDDGGPPPSTPAFPQCGPEPSPPLARAATLRVQAITTQPGPEALPRGRGQRSVLCLASHLPWPPASDAAVRLRDLLSWLAGAGHDVTLLACLREPPEAQQEAASFAACPNLLLLQPDGVLRYRATEGLEPGMVRSIPAESAATELAARLAAVLRPRIVLAADPDLARHIGGLPPGIRKVVDARGLPLHPVPGGGSAGPLVLSARDTSDVLGMADVLLVGRRDRIRELEAQVPGPAVVSVPMGVEVAGAAPEPAREPVLLLLASDEAAARDFLRLAWPVVRRQVPAARLLLAGGPGSDGPVEDPAILHLSDGTVPEDAFTACRAVICPGLDGPDATLRVLEGLRRLRPVVAWPAAADPLPPAFRSWCRVVTDWYGLAQEAASLCADASVAMAMIAARGEISDAAAPAAVHRDLAMVLEGAAIAEPPRP